MKTGQYDGVSASGDAPLRLIYGGDVAPVNTALVPNYADRLRLPQGQAVELGQRRDLRHPARLGRQRPRVEPGRGHPGARPRGARSSTRTRRTRARSRRTTRRSTSPTRRCTCPSHQARPEDHQPLRARRHAVPGCGRPAQDPARRSSASTGPTTPTRSTRSGAAGVRDRHGVADQRQPHQRRGQGKVDVDRPDRGRDRLVGHLDDRAKAAHPQLHVQVDGLDRLARGQRPGGGVVRRGSGAQTLACDETSDKTFCDGYHALDAAYANRSRTGRRRPPTASTAAARLQGLRAWVQAWTEIKG